MELMNYCALCGEADATKFRPGRHSKCRACSAKTSKAWRQANPAKNAAYKRKVHLRSYGITPDEYEAIWLRQAGLCAICEQPENGRRLSVDHDHTSGEVRGLLCSPCNVGLGHFRDAPSLLTAATNYLESV